MKLLNTLLVVIFTSLSFLNTSAQTKSETEAWIIDKLNNNSVWFLETHHFDNYKSSIFGSGFQYTISNGQLIVSYIETSKKISTKVSDLEWDKTEVKVKMLIPLQDFESLKQGPNENNMGGYNLETNRRSIKVYRNGTLLPGGAQLVTLGLDLRNDNLLERLTKAFLHLRSFYPKQKIKEVF